MALTYDIETDIRFMQGKELGIEQGSEKRAVKIITHLLKNTKLSVEEIAMNTEEPIKLVKELALKIRKK